MKNEKPQRHSEIADSQVDPFFRFLRARGWKDKPGDRYLGYFTKDRKEIIFTKTCIAMPAKIWGSEGIRLFGEFISNRRRES